MSSFCSSSSPSYLYLILILVATILAVYLLKIVIGKLLLRSKLAGINERFWFPFRNRWKNTPKDTIILHGFPPAKSIPNLSPYVLKVETYLRLANLPYKWDRKDFFGPKGKSPWITLNGKHVADSDLIIQYLGKKYEKDFNNKVSEDQLAMARVVRTTLEEYFTCVIGMERMIYGDLQNFKKIADIPMIFFYYMRHVLKNRFWEQGIARHTQEEVTNIMTKNFKAVSRILGGQKYFGENEMCEDDCGIFGVLAQCLWGLPDSPYEKLMQNECSNLRDYCQRIKKELWADWDHCLAK